MVAPSAISVGLCLVHAGCDKRPWLEALDVEMDCKVDRLGRDVCLKVLTGRGAAIDTTTATGKLVFGIFAALAEFERELIAERTIAGLASARARERKGGRPFKMTAAKLRLAMATMG